MATRRALATVVRDRCGDLGRTLVVLVDPRAPASVRRRAHRLRRLAGDVVVVPATAEDVDGCLAPLGDVGLLLDLADGVPRPVLTSAWWHLADGGVLVEPLSSSARRREGQLRWWRRTSRGRRAKGVTPEVARELGRSISSVRQDAGLLLVDKRVEHLYLLSEATVELLPARTGVSVEVLEVLPGGSHPTGRVVTHQGEVVPADEQLAPEVSLRHYTGPVSLYDGMVVSAGSTVLPETFKWFDHRPLGNGRLVNVGAHHARRRTAVRRPEPLPGSYYYFEYKNSGHYGHLMTEGLAKLWAWERVRALDPDVRLLMREHPRDEGRVNPRPDLAVLGAFGISEDDITWVRDPCEVSDLYTATPMIHNKRPYSIHPGMVEVWDQIRHGLLRQVESPPLASDRIFVTRRSGNRLCRNAEAVEELFDEHGFSIVHPERLTVAEQAAAFAGASVVAGFGGTGMFNLVHAANRPVVIVLNQESYDARNEDLITGLRGCDLHYFWSAADRSHPDDGFSYRAFQSEWAFDFERNGAPLRRLLADL